MDLFERQWDTYRAVVDHDWMEHRELSAACSEALQAWLADHPDRHMARAALGPVRYDVDLRHADVRDVVGGGGEAFDLVHAALVLHHLSDDDKAEFLAALRRRIRPDGLLVWADVFREPGETREEYVQRYASRIRHSWNDIDVDAREAIMTHMSTYDFAADRDAIVVAAQAAGSDWRWAWNGRHRAEAVAVLTPRPE